MQQGLTMGRAWLGLIYKVLFLKDTELNTDLDTTNILQMMGLLSERCNYHSTLQGVIVGNLLNNYIRYSIQGTWG